MNNDPRGESKRRAAEYAVSLVRDGQVLGLGTGSTAKFATEALALMVQDGLKIKGVATSKATALLAKGLGIPLVELNETANIDLTIDGADEVDPDFNMIKGGGGALTREKLVAIASKRRVMLVDESKLVDTLGKTRPLPVEVLSFCWVMTYRRLQALGCTPELRRAAGEPFLTDNGNYILDCAFSSIANPADLEKTIKLLPGVVESGLFVGLADALIVGYDDRSEVRERPALK
ncbi:MAG TPA: ribose-5-phosphate isomerase RpiA [Blastocatellia bacterium]|nr:ribose-5-phosphate isomerase RpiA [Blastocatellia bacterium]